LAQKHDKVTCATKQIERDSKVADATNSCPRKVQIKLVSNTNDNKLISIIFGAQNPK